MTVQCVNLMWSEKLNPFLHMFISPIVPHFEKPYICISQYLNICSIYLRYCFTANEGQSAVSVQHSKVINKMAMSLKWQPLIDNEIIWCILWICLCVVSYCVCNYANVLWYLRFYHSRVQKYLNHHLDGSDLFHCPTIPFASASHIPVCIMPWWPFAF